MYRESRLLMYIFCIQTTCKILELEMLVPLYQTCLCYQIVYFPQWCQIVPVLNCPLFIAVPNCLWCQIVRGAKLSVFHCGAKLSVFHYGAKLSAVPNCPWCQIVRFSLRCQIVRGAKLSVFTSRCQIVRVPNCPRCQIVRSAKLSGSQIVLGSIHYVYLCSGLYEIDLTMKLQKQEKWKTSKQETLEERFVRLDLNNWKDSGNLSSVSASKT